MRAARLAPRPTESSMPSQVFYGGDFREHVLCDGSGEDETCANAHAQPNPFTSADEHQHYFGEFVGAAACNRSATLAAARREWGAQAALRGVRAATPRPQGAAAGVGSLAAVLVMAAAATTLTVRRRQRRSWAPRLV